MSSNCARLTGATPRSMRLRPSHQHEPKASRYISPYQRTASGPMENAIGFMSGWTNIRIAD
jgi:hypothetical protein